MTAKPAKRPVNGVLLLDKPEGLSSNTALQKARRLYNAEKAGHTGVLDPLATGLLPVCFGEATKFAQYLLDADKAYIATLKLGEASSTGDAEGEIIATARADISLAEFQTACQALTGDIRQVPPMFSALKHEGKPRRHRQTHRHIRPPDRPAPHRNRRFLHPRKPHARSLGRIKRNRTRRPAPALRCFSAASPQNRTERPRRNHAQMRPAPAVYRKHPRRPAHPRLRQERRIRRFGRIPKRNRSPQSPAADEYGQRQTVAINLIRSIQKGRLKT